MRITIITVTYNAEATIRRTMESVAAQSHADIEHIVMDGASKDKTLDIVTSFQREAKEGMTIIVKSEPDKGLYDAMNKALKLATGAFVCFLNAGDKLHDSSTIAKIANEAEGRETDTAVIYGNTAIVDNDGTFLRPRRLAPPETLTWRSFKEGMLVCHQAFYLNRDIALPYDLSYRFSADFDWCIRCMKEGEKRGMTNIYIHDFIADYLSEGMTTANHKASLKERFRIMATHYGMLPTIIQHIWFIFRAAIKK